MNKLDCLKIKNFCSEKDPANNKLENGKQYLQTTYPTKVQGYVKDFQNST